LGRGGSDYTAAIIAAGVDATVVEIWTDVSGMMTADPRLYLTQKSFTIFPTRKLWSFLISARKYLSAYHSTCYEQEHSGVGEKYICASRRRNCIENTVSKNENNIRGISSINKIALLSLEGSGMVGIPGFSKRLFEALSNQKN